MLSDFVVQQLLFVNTDVLRTDCSGRPTTYGATAATTSGGGGYALISADNTTVISTLLCTACSFMLFTHCTMF